MDETERIQMRELLLLHQRRLHILQKRKATLGIDTPPQIVIEMEDIEDQIARLTAELAASTRTATTTPLLLEDFPLSLKSDIKTAEEVWLVGVSLVRTIRPYYPILMENLKRGHIVRVLVAHPTDSIIEPAVQRSFKPTSMERKRSEIIDTLQISCALRQQTSDKLQIRTIQYPLVYGAHVINPGKPSGTLYIKLYPYKLPIWKPKLVFHASEGGWYEYYLNELHMLWDNGTEWQCKQGV